MSSPQFNIITDWTLNTPHEKVWPVLVDAERWPLWWRAVKRVERIAEGDENGVGAVRRVTWSAMIGRVALPFALAVDMRTTRVEPMTRIEREAEGPLSGTGRWDVWPDGRQTRIRYEWRVKLVEPRLRMLAPLLRQAFIWNHAWTMDAGFKGLVAELGGQSARSQPLRRG